jgi:hypothetical protein
MAMMSDHAPSGALAAGLLREAADIVEGARNATHGEKERSFAAIASLWNAYLDLRRGGPRHGVSPHDVAVLMALMKIGRSEQGQAIRDHYVDAAGYHAIAGELAKVSAND